MEPNTSSSPAAWTSPATVVEHGEPSVRAPSLLSLAFSPAPSSPGLVPASGSGSGSSSYQQIPPSPPGVAVGNGSLSVHADATSSQSLPSSFPTAGTIPTVGYDLFGNSEVTAAATPLPTLLFGGQWEQGESSSRAVSVLPPECPSPGLLGFAGESAAWPSEETPSFFSPSSSGGLALQSSDDLVVFAQPSSDSELASLPQILRTPSLSVEESLPPLPPIVEDDEDEEIDVSAFLVSDPEDQPPNASWTATSPQMGGDGGDEASASWMVPGSTGNNSWTPMLAPAAASTCTTLISSSSGSMASHSGGSSIGVASSFGGMTKSSPAVPPQMPPLSHGAGASISNFNGFAQPSSSFVLAPPLAPPPNVQGPLLPVKLEVTEYADVTARRQPDFISLVDDDEDAIPCFIPGQALYPPVPETSSSRGSLFPLGSAPGLNGWARSSSGHSQEQSFASAAESRYNVFGSWGSNNSPSFAPGGWGGSSGSPSFDPNSWGGGGGSSSSPSFAPGSWGSSRPSFAPGSWGASSSSSRPSFAPNSWGSSSSSPNFAPGSWGASSSSRPSFAPGSWGDVSSRPSFADSMPCFNRSTSIDNYGSSSMPELSIGGMSSTFSALPPLPTLSLRASSRSSNGGGGIVFTDPEMAIIRKQKSLQELLKTDPKKVKRILYNRAYSTMAKIRKAMRTKDLERLVETLEMKRKSLYAELQSLEEGSAALKAKTMEMQMTMGELEQQSMLKDAVREALKDEIQKLKNLILN